MNIDIYKLILIIIYLLVIIFNIVFVCRLSRLRKRIGKHLLITVEGYWLLMIIGHLICITVLYLIIKKPYVGIGMVIGALFIFVLCGMLLWISDELYIYDRTGFWFGYDILLDHKHLYTELIGYERGRQMDLFILKNRYITLKHNTNNKAFYNFAISEYEKATQHKLVNYKSESTRPFDSVQNMKIFWWGMIFGSLVLGGFFMFALFSLRMDHTVENTIYVEAPIVELTEINNIDEFIGIKAKGYEKEFRIDWNSVGNKDVLIENIEYMIKEQSVCAFNLQYVRYRWGDDYYRVLGMSDSSNVYVSMRNTNRQRKEVVWLGVCAMAFINILWFGFAIYLIYEVKNFEKFDEERQKKIVKKVSGIRRQIK